MRFFVSFAVTFDNHPRPVKLQRRDADRNALAASFAVSIVREERKPKLVASYGRTKVAEFGGSGSGKVKQR